MAVGAVKLPLLNGENYLEWAPKLKAFLVAGTAENLWPVVESSASADQRDKDLKAKAHITMHVSAAFLDIVEEATTAHAAWMALKALHIQASQAKIVQLTEQLTSLSMQPKETVAAYMSRARALRRELKAAGDDTSETKVCQFTLKGLPAAYESIRTFLLCSESAALTLDHMQPKLQVHEQSVSALTKPTPSAAMSAHQAAGSGSRKGGVVGGGSGRARGGGRGYTGGGRGSGRGVSGSALGPCFWCGEQGHIKRDCPKKAAGERRALKAADYNDEEKVAAHSAGF